MFLRIKTGSVFGTARHWGLEKLLRIESKLRTLGDRHQVTGWQNGPMEKSMAN